jgi:uncharacterized protein (UPF0297 family)
MAAILESYGTSGLSLYAFIRDITGQIWNGSSFETYNVSNWATYAVTMTEQASSGYYKANFPSSIAAGLYSFGVHTGSPATAGDPLFDRGTIDFSGASQNYLGVIVDKLPSGDISGYDPINDLVYLASNQSGATIGTVNSIGTTARTQVNDEIIDVLSIDTVPELSSIPASTPTIRQILMIVYMALKNKRTASTTEEKIYNNAGTAIATASVSDSGSIYTKEQFS